MIKQLETYLLMSSMVVRRISLLFIIIILGAIDLATGYEYSFAVFYLIPVSIAAWYDNKHIAMIAVILSGITWLYADYSAGHQYTNSIIPFWNACVRLGFFSVVAFLLLRIKNNLNEMTLMAMKDSLTSLNNTRAFNLEYQALKKAILQKRTYLSCRYYRFRWL